MAGITHPSIIYLSAFDNDHEIQSTRLEMAGRRTLPNVFVGSKGIEGSDDALALQAQSRLVPLLVKRDSLSIATEEEKVE